MSKKVIIISGPTAVGKTKFSIHLAKKLNTEIISADSMQIYRMMDIGTAKIKDEEKKGIVHHMIDIRDPKDNFSVQDFQSLAIKIIDSLHNKDKIPIIVGGTGLYIDSLIYDYDFNDVKPDFNLRKKLSEEYNQNPNKMLDFVKSLSDDYSKLNLKDKKKIIRILEVYKKSGKLINYNRKLSSKYDIKLFILNDNRDKIYSRINDRVEYMLNEGLIDEVKNLVNMGLNDHYQSMKAIGYKEVYDYLMGKLSYNDMVDLLKKNSRHYAKRQLTWFRRNEKSIWIDINKDLDKIYNQAEILGL